MKKDALVAITLLLLVSGLYARGIGDQKADIGSETRIVQAGSAAFIVQNALYLFPEAQSQVVAVADGNQGNGFFIGDLDPLMSEKTILPRQVNTEALLSEKPDVVVMKNFMKSSMGVPLDNMGMETLYLDLESPESWYDDLEKLGELFNNTERAMELQNLFSTRLADIEGPQSGLTARDRPSTLFIYWSVKDGVNAVNVPPLGWMQTRMVEIAGGDPVWKNADLAERWTRVNIEQIAAWDPDHIVMAAYHIPTTEAIETIKSDPLWAELSAIQNGRIHAFPVDYHSWDQPDVRWLLGTLWLAKQLHPDLYSDVNLTDETRQFYREFFLMTEEEIDVMIFSRLGNSLD